MHVLPRESAVALESEAVLLTATRRLARVLRQDYASWQRGRDHGVWKSPAILPLDAYLSQLWSGRVLRGGTELALLTRQQEALVWEEVIRDSRDGNSLLQIAATARRAREAWGLVNAYRVPLDGRFAGSGDCEAFREWAREYERRCYRRKWLDGARLADIILEGLRSGEIARPASVFFAGFDEVSPQQDEFFREIGASAYEPRLRRTVTRTKVCATSEDEIRCAAAWARSALEDDPGARIGVVALGLAQLRSKIERILREELQPGAGPEAESAFHISLGRPLGEYPPIHAALLALDLGRRSMTVTRVGMLLRSPFLRGAREEREARAILDARLRRLAAWEIPLDVVRRHAASECRVLSRSLDAFSNILAASRAAGARAAHSSGQVTAAAAPDEAARLDELHAIGGSRSHGAWRKIFSELLAALGWPGDRAPSSREHQLLSRWTELLSEFSSLDAVSGDAISLDTALDRLRGLASAAVFQFEDPGSPIQISDAGEAAGMQFDRLWAMGFHDEAFPPPAAPNPFIPIPLQIEFRVPGAGARSAYEAARTTFDRLIASAPNIVLSFPQSEGDRALSPSPFLTAPPAPTTASPGRWAASIRASAELETIVDENALPLRDDELAQRGGATLLRDMAACPFRRIR